MRVSLLVYGVLYVAMEMVGHQLAVVGWQHVTTLDVATALADTFLIVAIGLAVLLAADLGLRRWRRMRAERSHEDLAEPAWADDPIEVPAWRAAPDEFAVPPPPPPSKGTYAGNPYSYAGHRWPTEPGRQL